MDHDDLDEDIERLNIALQEEGEDDEESEGELRILDNNEDEYNSNASRPSTSSDVTASSQPTTSVCTDADESVFRFDPHSITAETCLAMNRAYQEVLLDTLRQIEMSLIENRQRQRELEESVDEKTKKTDKPTNKDVITFETRHLPYFKDKNGEVPPYNEDVIMKEKMNEEKQHVQPKPGWTKLQRKELIDAIKLDALEQLVRPLLNKQELEMEKIARCKNNEEVDEVKARIEKIQQEIKQKQELPAEELLKSADSTKIDFMKIANFKFNSKFSAMECESMWNNVLRPGINRNRWTEKEEEELTNLATKYEMRNWKQIAEELGTNRTPFQCLQHYQQNNIVYDYSEWKEEEDELLKEVVETCTYGMSKIHWHQVAYYIDRRSASQCRTRWGRINQKRNFGRWTKEEDTQLLNAIQRSGGNVEWTKIQDFVPTRTGSQCRERFTKGMGGYIHFKPWTYENDKRLLLLHQHYGDQWAKIADHFDNRTESMIVFRYKLLMKWQSLMDDFYNEKEHVQKQMKHPAFKFGKEGLLIPKSGLKLRIGGGQGRPTKMLTKPSAVKREIRLLKETGGKEAEAALEEIFDEVKHEEEEGREIEDEESEGIEEEMKGKKIKELQDKLDVFLGKYNIQAEDYLKQAVDKGQGGIIVPRPPPINKILTVQTVWKKQNKLTDVVQTQIDIYLNKLQEKFQNEGVEKTQEDLNLYEQVAKHVQMEDEKEKRQKIRAAFGGKNPSKLTVRELLNISRCIKEHGRPPNNPLTYDKEPWEEESSDDDNAENLESSSESDIEEVSEDEEPKPKKPRSERQVAHQELLAANMKKIHEVDKEMQNLIQLKMDPLELGRIRGRKKQFKMYPKKTNMKYRSFNEDRKLNRKSLVLLMKTLDVDGQKAYIKAKRGKRKVSAMAFLKSAEKANLKRAKTRRQKTEIQEAAKAEANINAEISEASEFLLELKDELKVSDREEEEEEEEEGLLIEDNTKNEGQDQVSNMYNKSLPYIPPNQTNLSGMRSLLMEHRYLIDQAGYHFSPSSLRQKLYELKQKGPNPLMGVLNAIGKTESASKRLKKQSQETKVFTPAVCQEQLKEVRKTRAYQQLKARFHSVFSWPAFLATIQPPRGKPLPKTLQELLVEPRPSGSKNSKKNAVRSEGLENVVNETFDDNAAGKEGAGGRDGDTAEGVIDLPEDLPEEEAVEKLVDNIMKEYEKERVKKKRYLPAKRYRNFSEKRKQAFVEKERTKILKRLGLYDKMKEFKQRRQETKQSEAASVASTSNVNTNITSGTEPKAEKGVNASVAATETQGSSEITSVGHQTDFDIEDADTTETAVVKTEIPKRKRGRPVGAKTKCYADKSPERKSRRSLEKPKDSPVVVKQDQDLEMPPTKKKSSGNKTGVQYSFVRNLIPEKMGKIASHIPDLPILNEPVKENVKKPRRKPKVPKPIPERKKVARSKFVKNSTQERKGMRGPKTNRILEKVQEEEKKKLATTKATKIKSTKASTDQIKNEPSDSNEVEDNINVTCNSVVATEVNSAEIIKGHGKIMTSRARKKVQALKQTRTPRSDVNSDAKMGTLDTVLNENQSDGINKSPQNVNHSCSVNAMQSANANDSQNTVTGNPDETPSSDQIPSHASTEQDRQKVLDNTSGVKPILVAVPVMIGDTQQVAMIPFYPDKDGKITLPNGKKIDATSSQGPSTSGSISLPVVSFDQPVQVINPNQSAPMNQTKSKASVDSSDKSEPNK